MAPFLKVVVMAAAAAIEDPEFFSPSPRPHFLNQLCKTFPEEIDLYQTNATQEGSFSRLSSAHF